ncbi:MAG: hypothetical protein PWP23_889 [Candidatus Sumerlaeota bacterium]|nr:hypothetical protein [Candidatus Sumerlaeota bacterium]
MVQQPFDDSPTGLQATDYVVHLWKRRFWIVGLSLLALVGTYVGLWLFHPNVFETRALILVREQPRMNNMENDKPGIDPPSFRGMFTSDEVIEYVRRQYNTMVEDGFFDGEPEGQHAVIETPLEKLRPRFRTASSATVDTTIITEYSPVIELQVRGNSQGQALALMNLWTSHLLEKYGNLLNEEARFLIDSTRRRTEDLKQELGTIVAQQTELQAERELIEARIDSNLRQLTWAPRRKQEAPVDNEIIGFNMYSGPRESSLTIEQNKIEGPMGLYELQTQLLLEKTRLEARNSDGALNEELAQLEAEIAEVETRIPEIEQQVRTGSATAAALASQIASLGVELNRLQYAVRLNSTVGAPAEALLRAVDEEAGEGDPLSDSIRRYGTLRLLSKPVVPQEKIWPRRSLLSLGAGGGLFLLLILIFIGELYLRASLRLQTASKA